MKWILSFLLGTLLWYLLTFAFGVFIGKTGLIKLPIFYENIGSNFYNLFLYPVGMWLGFKLTGTPFFGKSSYTSQTEKDEESLSSDHELAQQMLKQDEMAEQYLVDALQRSGKENDLAKSMLDADDDSNDLILKALEKSKKNNEDN